MYWRGVIYARLFLTMLPRLIIGFSDATSLFSALRQRGHQNLIHGPMVQFLADETDEESKQSLHALLRNSPGRHLIGEHLCGPKTTVRAPLIGGNLSVLASLAGTPWAHGRRDAIVLFEDVSEHAYRMDRTITQLCNSGFFDGVKGIVLGEFTRCILPAGADFHLDEMFCNLLSPLNVPVIKNIGVGHGIRNMSWKVGEQVTMHDGALHFS